MFDISYWIYFVMYKGLQNNLQLNGNTIMVQTWNQYDYDAPIRDAVSIYKVVIHQQYIIVSSDVMWNASSTYKFW